MNWRIQTFDKAIMRARERGFNDMDFTGWEDMDGNTRIKVIDQILRNNGAAHILFRKSFAKALWGFPEHDPGLPAGTQIINHGWKYHIQQMVVCDIHPNDQDSWLAYLRDHRELWDYKDQSAKVGI